MRRFLSGLLLVLGTLAFAQDRTNARSMVISPYGIVASSQVQASQAGAEILSHGGSAGDAAIATNAVLGVLEPDMNGMGGDLFAIYWDAKTGKLYGLNASGWAPKGLTIDYLKSKNVTEMPGAGIDTVTVPGAVEGWNKLHERFGRMAWKDLFTPAIFYGESGFAVQELIGMDWGVAARAKLKVDPETRRVFLVRHGSVNDEAPQMGEVFRNPDVAKALRLLAEGGPRVFYGGGIAKAILATSRATGGTMTADDLETFSAEWVEPISTTYRGWKVYELPPNGQGIAALSMLNIMEQFPMAQYGHSSTDALHVMIEAKKLAYADMYRYVGDPRFTPVPIKEMVSKELAEQRAKLIQMGKASCQTIPSNIAQMLNAHGKTTIYLSTIDKDGNIVSLIQSNFAGYGTGMVAPGLGFSFHNRGAGFQLTPGLPNSLAGRKRPLHTIIPAFMEKGDVNIGFGIMGGWNQAQAHAQFVANIVDYGMNVQAALEQPRFTKDTFEGCDVQMENTIPISPQIRGLG